MTTLERLLLRCFMTGWCSWLLVKSSPFISADVKLAGDAKEGERIFYGGTADTRAGCAICHSLEPGLDTVGPSLAGIARARRMSGFPGFRRPEYLRQAILQPDAYLVAGFTAGRMPSNYGELLI